MKEILSQLILRQNLTAEQMRSVFGRLMNGELSEPEMAAFLVALECKGLTAEELAAAASVMREKVTPVPIAVEAVDTCGTGGDGICTFNVSTASAIVAAGAGIYVAKHGNRTNTRRSGSAEAFAALGVNIDADVETIARCIREARIGFCFAVKLHPAMKYAAAVRKALAVRTIFNLLGPMTNPAAVKRQIIGVARENLVETLAQALNILGVERAMIVHGREGLCDISIAGPSVVCEVVDGQVHRRIVSPGDFGLAPQPLDAITIDSPQNSAQVIRDVLAGKTGPARDIVTLNAGAAILVAGQAKDLQDGMQKAKQSIDSGSAMAALEKLIAISKG